MNILREKPSRLLKKTFIMKKLKHTRENNMMNPPGTCHPASEIINLLSTLLSIILFYP